MTVGLPAPGKETPPRLSCSAQLKEELCSACIKEGLALELSEILKALNCKGSTCEADSAGVPLFTVPPEHGFLLTRVWF